MLNIITDFPIAFDSPDHLVPLGTKNDNHTNPRFIKACEQWVSKQNKKLTILDIGCAGGGCVEKFVERGHDAYGLEGSNYSLKNKRAAWATIPERLYTCDVSRPFLIFKNDRLLKFDIIYSVEVMEHIYTRRLPIYFSNIYTHLRNNGLFVGSFTTTKSSKFPDHHQTIMNPKQWRKYISKLGIFNIVDLGWSSKNYLRTSKLKENCIPITLVKKYGSSSKL